LSNVKAENAAGVKAYLQDDFGRKFVGDAIA
jgi:hypothetical protein